MKYTLILICFYCFIASDCWAQAPTVTFNTVISSNLVSPIQLKHCGDGTNRIFVAEKGGRVKVFDHNYNLYDTLIWITGMGTANEQGLLSLAFHPDFKNNGYFFVWHTQVTTNNLILDRYTISNTDPDKADVASRLSILNIPHPNFTNHNGGEIHFGKDGYLYVSTGDGGGGDDPQDNGQDSLSLLGKILRIDINNTSGSNNYAIPAGNPNPNSPVYCYGLRNPFRWSFDRHSGDMFIGDVGQGAREEISHRPSGQIASSNFGWDCFEGNLPHATAAPCLPASNYIAPIYEYPINSSNRSVVGGNVYRGYAYPDLKGWYFAADYFSRDLRKIKYNGTTWDVFLQQMPTTYTGMVDFDETENGELYMVDITTHAVIQITSSNSKTVYTFTGNGDWTETANWKGGSVPPNPLPSGSVIVIKPYNNGICELKQNFELLPGSNFYVEPGANFSLGSPSLLRIR